MAPPHPTALELSRGLRTTVAAPGLTPYQAMLYSQHIRITLGRPGLAGFGKAAVARRLDEAMTLIDAALVERDADPSVDWRASMKRAAEILEWLGSDGSLDTAIPTFLLAAAAYQVAGYPALAGGLLATAPTNVRDSTVVRSFLRADFQELLVESHRAIRDLPPPKQARHNKAARIDHAIRSETIRSLAVIAAAMRWSDEDRLQPAIEKLRGLAALARHSRVAHSSLMATLCALVAEQYAGARLWQRLTRLSAGRSHDVAEAYASFGRRAFVSARSLVWKSQDVGIERIVSGGSFVLCTPTGSGKTTVAELGLIGDLLDRADASASPLTPNETAPLALYLVPSRALASEIERRLERDLSHITERRIVVTGMYGGTDWGPTDAWLTASDPTVLICTYEKAEALLRFLGVQFLDRVCTVIIDEAHSVQFDGKHDSLRRADSRSLKLETLAIRLLNALHGHQFRLLALSAVTAGLEGHLTHWLVGPESSPAHSDHRSTRQLVGRLECLANGGFRIHYDLLDRSLLRFASSSEAPFVPSPFPPHPPAASFATDKPLVRLRPYLAWAAFQLAKPDSAGRAHSVLISITSNITTYANSFLTLIESDWADLELPAFFTLPRSEHAIHVWQECLDTAADYFTKLSPEYRLLLHGIAVHHGKMPALLARKLKQVIEDGIVRVVMATSTLSEGVNLPVEYILVPDVFRGQDTIPNQEFLNLVGRAGRPGFATEGRTLVLVPPQSSKAYSDVRLTTGYWQVVNRAASASAAQAPSRPPSPLAELLSMLHREWQGIAPGQDEAAFLAWLEVTPVVEHASNSPTPALECLDTLDSILLAAVEELGQLRRSAVQLGPTEVDAGLRAIWANSLAHVTAQEEGLLSRVFLRRGSAIPKLYPDPVERRRLYKTSLPPLSARKLLSLVPSLQTLLQSGADYASRTDKDRYAFVESVVESVASVPRFAPGGKAGRSNVAWKDVLRWWLDPKGAARSPKPDQIGPWHEYASSAFAFKANWALGSVVALSLDAVDDGSSSIALSLEGWPKSGLPWSAFWLKELLIWGTLDPVAAFLLARGDATTRTAANTAALDYYESQRDEPDVNARLDPRKIRDWATAIHERVDERRARPRIESVINVQLDQAQGKLKQSRVRVLPRRESDGCVAWVDAAAYRVASSGPDSFPRDWPVDGLDFVLDVDRRSVAVSEYL